MLHTPPVPIPVARRGMVLLVVIALLTLFAVVGLSFVLYANSAATSARIFCDSESHGRPDIEPELLFSYFMGQLIFDVPDDERGVYSALRGHSLARSMFGYNDEGSNDTPFNGTGRLRYSITVPGLGQVDDFSLINYTYFRDLNPSFLRDPERPGWRASLGDSRKRFVGGFNAPYTYPDLNNLFLGAVNAGGTVLQPSFYRDWVPYRDSAGGAVGDFFGRLDDIPNEPPGNPGNPNWSNVKGRYLLLRPRPLDMGPRFPYPEDAGGDVKNLIGAPGGNDSIWIDLDFPVMTARDGRKFKPLFAALIVDLDNRVNVNAHGNVRASEIDPSTGKLIPTHVSNQGWGAWEVNPAKVLNKDAGEYTNLLMGGVPSIQGRYGRENHPHSGLPQESSIPLPRRYAPVDFDAAYGPVQSAVRSAQLRLPETPFQCFPPLPPGYTFGTDFLNERIGHPNLFNPFQPAEKDRAFALSNMEALLRYGDTGSPALASELIRLCPNNLADRSDPESARRRGLLTVRSFDPDRPGVTPWLWWDSPPATYQTSREVDGLPLASPKASAIRFPTPPTARDDRAPPRSEFGDDWRANRSITGLRRLNLNRYLPPYPAIKDATGLFSPADYDRFLVAQRARQYMAAEIFECLFKLTGVNPDVRPPPNLDDVDKTDWNAAQWLAQLAVNVVDYIDDDDYMTPFNWYPLPWRRDPRVETLTRHWVFGTELPRVLINEVYAENARVGVNIWVELYNPLSTDESLPSGGAVRLGGPNQPYRLLVTAENDSIRNPSNVRGDPNGHIYSAVSFGTDNQSLDGPSFIRPADGALEGLDGGNKGYYVLGPGPLDPAPLPGLRQTGPTLTLQAGALGGARVSNDPWVLLRRLACPALPHDNNPSIPGRPSEANPYYNPYITVDYMADIPRNDRVDANRASLGRIQPYAASQGCRQITDSFSGTNQPKHTFFRANDQDPSGGHTPFDWLVHLDRKLISPVELLHVSAFKPHELTQQFIDSSGRRFKHRVAWLDEDIVSDPQNESRRLYRALEFLSTGNETVGMMTATTRSRDKVERGIDRFKPQSLVGTTLSGGTWEIGKGCSLIIDKGKPTAAQPIYEEVVFVKDIDENGFVTADFLKRHKAGFTITPTTISERVPGKININTIWDEETFLALCDPYDNDHQRSNNFNLRDVREIYETLRKLRTAGDKPGPRDEPFRSLATGLAPSVEQLPYLQSANSGIEATLLRKSSPASLDKRLFELDVGTDHPYMRMELLTKIFNNVTVRSNVFAVWVTVGYFEVTDDSARPVKLGAEIGRAENRQIRHRMFGIVDRSVLTRNPGPQPRFDPRNPAPWVRPEDAWATGPVVPYFSIID